jgi:hypothetical protein
MNLLFLALALFAPVDTTPRTPVLAELFTSEGCSSCPPADLLLRKLDQLQPIPGARVIVLSEHVDYWNQLGWKDPFSSAEFSRRQSDYARVLGADVYTPQLVIDGRDAFVGSDAQPIQAAIARAAARVKTPVRITAASRESAEAAVSISIPALARGKADVWVALADESDRSSVQRGENTGRTLDHVAVLRSLRKVASVSKSEGFEKTVRLPVSAAASRVVVFVEAFGGPVLGADSAAIR